MRATKKCVQQGVDRLSLRRYEAVKKRFQEGMQSSDPLGYKGMLHALELERENNEKCPEVVEGIAELQAPAAGGVGGAAEGEDPTHLRPLSDVDHSAEEDDSEFRLSVPCCTCVPTART